MIILCYVICVVSACRPASPAAPFMLVARDGGRGRVALEIALYEDRVATSLRVVLSQFVCIALAWSQFLFLLALILLAPLSLSSPSSITYVRLQFAYALNQSSLYLSPPPQCIHVQSSWFACLVISYARYSCNEVQN
ncbi:hypothetical protein L226DRAFT_203250 [Lentinus tigrinus ALCF2SS1-7]|uniref:Uncharacterized protein n=1 Tax=Lentinus tigrinus ALCF2SS1-6 TaxID=1328759 RepID=A0A5C2ST86_9APHY|nr:hypothetical protein L227DRAFT_149768 [Lentinus tigrinus ALCF2SS1-6]RPD80538.1 hypothetical protein L226DRAFT_203250 [Lentinus tigrinus ALCF2SS1-7]